MTCPGFGELNIPTLSSRAFWDDCDEDEIPSTEPEKLQLYIESREELDKAISKANLLLVIEGPHVSTFAESVLLKDSKKLAGIPCKKSSLHFIASNGTLIAIVEEDLSKSGEITELLISEKIASAPKDVFTLSIKPKVDYKSENIAAVQEEITFLRSLGGKVNYVEPLEAPNFICGVTAGIATWRCNEGLDVQVFLAYTDNVALDYLAAKPVIKLLRDLNINCANSYHFNKANDSHLYM
uniref:Proteasome assembly chaperone 1 n=1 Tax=Glossina brevipalpis TaxID=37001 RepID=A0A1A9WGT6_9MUSC